jgi:glycosyltransferase involved in cell wall biosynthesis
MAASRRVLFVTADRVGGAMAGPAIRSVELARVLAVDHDVTVATPWVGDDAPDDVAVVRAWGDDLRPWATYSDVVVAMPAILHEHPWMAELDVAVVADAYDPVLFEVLEQFAGAPLAERRERTEDSRARMVEPLRDADLVLCASEHQRHLVLGMLAAHGRLTPEAYDRDRTARSFVAVVPFGLPGDAPVSTRRPLRGAGGPFDDDDFILLWGGGLYDWLDPITLIRAVAEAPHDVGVAFLAGTHPTPSVPPMASAAAARREADRLGVADRAVFVDQWVPYRDRADWLLDADVGVSMHRDHLEATFAFRTRALDYLWSGLPMLCTAGDAVADLVERRGMGQVVEREEPSQIVDAVDRLRDPEVYARCADAVAETAAEFAWETVAQPLVDFCRAPRRAPDRPILADPPQVARP